MWTLASKDVSSHHNFLYVRSHATPDNWVHMGKHYAKFFYATFWLTVPSIHTRSILRILKLYSKYKISATKHFVHMNPNFRSYM